MLMFLFQLLVLLLQVVDAQLLVRDRLVALLDMFVYFCVSCFMFVFSYDVDYHILVCVCLLLLCIDRYHLLG